jgi:hypothetical protein
MTTELDAFQKAVRGGQAGLTDPDILVVEGERLQTAVNGCHKCRLGVAWGMATETTLGTLGALCIVMLRGIAQALSNLASRHRGDPMTASIEDELVSTVAQRQHVVTATVSESPLVTSVSNFSHYSWR